MCFLFNGVPVNYCSAGVLPFLNPGIRFGYTFGENLDFRPGIEISIGMGFSNYPVFLGYVYGHNFDRGTITSTYYEFEVGTVSTRGSHTYIYGFAFGIENLKLNEKILRSRIFAGEWVSIAPIFGSLKIPITSKKSEYEFDFVCKFPLLVYLINPLGGVDL